MPPGLIRSICRAARAGGRQTALCLPLVLFAAIGCGIDGSRVVHESDFRRDVDAALQTKVLLCLPQSGESNFDIGAELLAAFAAATSGFSSRYFLRTDVEFCINAILAQPCRGTAAQLASDLLLIQGLYCTPKPACVLNQDSFGQGGWCSR